MSTENSHTQNAQARIDEIRAMRQKVPNFVFPSSKGDGRRLVNAARVPPEFIELTTVATTNTPALTRGGSLDAGTVRDLVAFADAYGPVAGDLEALARFIRHSISSAKNKAGSEALTTYALTQRLAKRPETADLAPQVEEMRRVLGRRPRKTKSGAPPTQPS